MDVINTFLLATTNEGKAVEMREGLHGLSVALMTLADLSDPPDQPCETGNTFEENAIQKAQYYFDRTGIPSIADDSGILVDALEGELGIHTRRWGAGPLADDAAWIKFFLDRMKREQNKRAEFISVLALVDGNGAYAFEGKCIGIITETLESDYLPGLPISACFRPDGFDKVFSALPINEKNDVSHRGEAVKKLREHVEKLY